MRCVVVASTAGSVMNEVLRNPFFRECVHSVVVDRDCGAVEKSQSHKVPVQAYTGMSNEDFCARLHEYLDQCRIDYVFSFYTRFYAAPIRAAYTDRLINFHPSLLPAFKGMDGFGDTVRYGARVGGMTVELIHERMDEGKIVMQSVFPVDPGRTTTYLRHRLFVQTCKALLQTARWLADGRIRVMGRKVAVDGATYTDSEFFPALDFDDAVNLHVPRPTDLQVTGPGDE